MAATVPVVPPDIPPDIPPVVPTKPNPRCQAVTDLIESVALEETALSHILNAEGEKMQAIIAKNGVTTEELMKLNTSVNKLINSITRLEMTFQSKLEIFSCVNDECLQVIELRN